MVDGSTDHFLENIGVMAARLVSKNLVIAHGVYYIHISFAIITSIKHLICIVFVSQHLICSIDMT